jgi:UDP-N-acetylmuramoyl-L-alanyl-D-glutamate--2,6-diaminopimelate ligase
MTISIGNHLKKAGITHITSDSRQVQKGSAFFAVSEEYIDQAVELGAKMIVSLRRSQEEIRGSWESCETLGSSPRETTMIYVPDVRIALAEAAECLYPETPDHIVAVTGTSGKTSIASYFMQICELLGHKAASIGSLGVKCTDKKLEAELARNDELTTPDIISMRKILSTLKQGGIDYVAFEASSHGLDQRRVYGIKVDAAAFTNLSDDHLDYHGTFDAYFEAKLKLFSENLRENGRVIFSDEMSDYLNKSSLKLDHKILTVGRSGDIKIIASKPSISGQEITFTYLGKSYNFTSMVLGSFQADNLLMAAALAQKVLKVDFADIVEVLTRVVGAHGRLERITDLYSSYHIFVDYSYKSDALAKVLKELKNMCKGRLLVVFGCGGDRNKEKRPIMGSIASKFADIVIITDDNPRTEDAAKIRAEVALGAGSGAIEIAGREEAIAYAISQMQDQDVLLIAGKGHENYQIIGDKKLPFDDCLIAKKYIGVK